MRSFLEGLVYVLGLIFCFAIATFTPSGSRSNRPNNSKDSTSLDTEKQFSYWSQTWPPLASSFLIFLTMYIVIMMPLLAYESVPWIMLFLGSLVVCIGAICIYIVSAYVTEVGIGICHGVQSTIVILLFASAIDKFFNNGHNDGSDIDVKVDPESDRIQLLTPFEPITQDQVEGMRILIKAKGKCTHLKSFLYILYYSVLAFLQPTSGFDRVGRST